VPERTKPWYDLDDDAEMLGALQDLCVKTFERDGKRIERYRDAVSRYELRELDGLSPYAYGNAADPQIDNETKLRWAVGRAIVATALAKIAGVQQPKVQFVTSGASWKIKRKSKKADRFIAGLWSTRQEPYADIHELCAYVALDALTCGTGAIKVSADEDFGRVRHERVLPEDLACPQDECRYGSPQTLIHRFDASRSELRAWFTEKGIATVIDDAPAGTSSDFSGIWTKDEESDERLCCFDVITLANGPKSPGRHVLFIKGTTTPLVDEDWTRDSFPTVLLHYSRALRGMWGPSLLDETAGSERAINELLARILNTVRRTSMNYVVTRQTEPFADTAVPVNPDLDHLVPTVDAEVIPYQGSTPPTLVTPQPVAPAVLNLLDRLWGKAFELSGINQMSATAQKQPGIVANSALLTLADMQSERFSIFWRAYQKLFPEVARQDIYAVRSLAEKHADFAARWKGEDFFREIAWKELDLQDDQFVVDVQPAPSTKDTAAERLQSAEDLFQRGLLTGDALVAIRTYFDTPGEVDRMSRQREYIDRMIERWLDATDEQLASGMYDEETQTLLVPAPLPMLRLEDAIVQVGDAYCETELCEPPLPDAMRECFLNWLGNAQEAIEQKQARAAANQAQQGPQPEQVPNAQPVPAAA